MNPKPSLMNYSTSCEMIQRVEEGYEGNDSSKFPQEFSHIGCQLMEVLSAKEVRRSETTVFPVGMKGTRRDIKPVAEGRF